MLLMLPIPTVAAAVFLLLLNAVVNKFSRRYVERRVSSLEVLGIAFVGQFLFRLLLQLVIYAYVFFTVAFR